MSKSKTVMSHDPLAELGEPTESENPVNATGEAEEAAIAGAPGDDQAGTAPTDEEAAADGVLELDVSLSIGDVADLQGRIQMLIDRGLPVEIDGTSLEILDGAGLQLLAAFFKDADAKGLALSWRGGSEPLQRAAATLGLVDVLKLRDVA